MSPIASGIIEAWMWISFAMVVVPILVMILGGLLKLISLPFRVAAYAVTYAPPKQEMPEAPTARQLEYEAGWKSIEDSLVELYGSAK